MSLNASLQSTVNTLPIINTHSHLLQAEFFKEINLRRLIKNAYVSWAAPPFDESVDAPLPEEWFERVRLNSYFVSLQRGLQELYGITEPLAISTWDAYNDAVIEAHKDPEWHIKVLRDKCRYKYVIQDSYWNPGGASAEEMFVPTFRINMFFYFHDLLSLDHNGNNVLNYYKLTEPFPSLSCYLSFMYNAIKERKSDCVSLKCALAYDRDMRFSDETSSVAEQCYERLINSKPKPDDLYRLQNHVFFRMCEMAGELEMPFQCHVGLGKLDRTRAIYLLEAIESNMDTKFVLFHGSYPYLSDIFALCHNLHNIFVDICWLPIVSPAAAERFVDEYIEVGASNAITWGCDTWTSEESYGALLTARDVLCKVVANKIESGYFSESDGNAFLKGIFSDNAKSIYSLL